MKNLKAFSPPSSIKLSMKMTMTMTMMSSLKSSSGKNRNLGKERKKTKKGRGWKLWRPSRGKSRMSKIALRWRL